MPVSGLALAASAGLRIASLNLCTDELLLALAKPHEIVSVSYLSRLPEESVLWRQARRFPLNRGTLESAVSFRPNLILTMGGGGRASATIARRLGMRVITLPYPQTIADLEKQSMTVARALGSVERAGPIRRRLAALRASRPRRLIDAAFAGGGGLSLAPDSLGAEWLSLAGYRQLPLRGNRLTFEQLAARPPTRLILSNYRSEQLSRGQDWLRHPLVRQLAGRSLTTDGRAWTCAGWPMIDEVGRLRDRSPTW